MAIKTKEQIVLDAQITIPDNTSRLVSPEDVRERIIDIAESAAFNGALPTSSITGSYNDLINKPALKAVATTGMYNDLINKPALSPVATTGSYNDLINRPLLVPVATSGSYNDLIDKPVPPVLAPVAYSGSYNDLVNKPIPPALAAVALSGLYDDLLNKPTLGTIASRNITEFATSAQGTKADNAVQFAAQSLSAAQQLRARQNIAAFAQPTGNTSQYLRGDGTLAAMNKATVGLGSVDNTSDANKPVSNAMWAQLNARVSDTRFAGYIEHSYDAGGGVHGQVFDMNWGGYVCCRMYKPRSWWLTVGWRQPQVYIPSIGWRALGGW